MSSRTKIHPVIVPVPETDQKLMGRDKVKALSRHARQALSRSARYGGHTLGPLEKNDRGAPLPSNGIHWSLTHKEHYVAAVTAPHRVGIDIERIRPCSQRLYERIADPREWGLAPEQTLPLFFRYWTAKEAVLKAVSKGLVGLTRCRIHKILDDNRVALTYDGGIWIVVQYWIGDDHIVAVTASDDEVEWHLLGQ